MSTILSCVCRDENDRPVYVSGAGHIMRWVIDERFGDPQWFLYAPTGMILSFSPFRYSLCEEFDLRMDQKFDFIE